MRSAEFFETHPVFTHAEFVAAHTAIGRSSRTSNNLLARYLATGRLVRIRRGLYASVPRGVDPNSAAVDPYLVVTHLAEDATVAYHAALQFAGRAYSTWRRFHYVTAKRSKPLGFRDLEFVPTRVPSYVSDVAAWNDGMREVAHAGGRVRVATLERTMVDVLDRPDKGGGWEEIWRSLEMVEFFDLDEVIGYALRAGSALTVGRVGFYLEQHRESLMVTDEHLRLLRPRAPKQPRYLDSSRKPGALVTSWNIIVPHDVLERSWEERG
jgi:predicted transcriptional regulator of viral defense system